MKFQHFIQSTKKFITDIPHLFHTLDVNFNRESTKHNDLIVIKSNYEEFLKRENTSRMTREEAEVSLANQKAKFLSFLDRLEESDLNSFDIPETLVDNKIAVTNEELVGANNFLLEKVFGVSFDLTGLSPREYIRNIRLRNNVLIFSKVKDMIEGVPTKINNLAPKDWHPFLEHSSLEQEENIQEFWAKLLAHGIVHDSEGHFLRRGTEVLKTMDAEKAKILDLVYKKYLRLLSENDGDISSKKSISNNIYEIKIPKEEIISTCEHKFKFLPAKITESLDHFVNLGILSIELPKLSIESEKAAIPKPFDAEDNPEPSMGKMQQITLKNRLNDNNHLDEFRQRYYKKAYNKEYITKINAQMDAPSHYLFTRFGIKFMLVCCEKETLS